MFSMSELGCEVYDDFIYNNSDRAIVDQITFTEPDTPAVRDVLVSVKSALTEHCPWLKLDTLACQETASKDEMRRVWELCSPSGLEMIYAKYERRLRHESAEYKGKLWRISVRTEKFTRLVNNAHEAAIVHNAELNELNPQLCDPLTAYEGGSNFLEWLNEKFQCNGKTMPIFGGWKEREEFDSRVLSDTLSADAVAILLHQYGCLVRLNENNELLQMIKRHVACYAPSVYVNHCPSVIALLNCLSNFEQKFFIPELQARLSSVQKFEERLELTSETSDYLNRAWLEATYIMDCLERNKMAIVYMRAATAYGALLKMAKRYKIPVTERMRKNLDELRMGRLPGWSGNREANFYEIQEFVDGEFRSLTTYDDLVSRRNSKLKKQQAKQTLIANAVLACSQESLMSLPASVRRRVERREDLTATQLRRLKRFLRSTRASNACKEPLPSHDVKEQLCERISGANELQTGQYETTVEASLSKTGGDWRSPKLGPELNHGSMNIDDAVSEISNETRSPCSTENGWIYEYQTNVRDTKNYIQDCINPVNLGNNQENTNLMHIAKYFSSNSTQTGDANRIRRLSWSKEASCKNSQSGELKLDSKSRVNAAQCSFSFSASYNIPGKPVGLIYWQDHADSGSAVLLLLLSFKCTRSLCSSVHKTENTNCIHMSGECSPSEEYALVRCNTQWEERDREPSTLEYAQSGEHTQSGELATIESKSSVKDCNGFLCEEYPSKVCSEDINIGLMVSGQLLSLNSGEKEGTLGESSDEEVNEVNPQVPRLAEVLYGAIYTSSGEAIEVHRATKACSGSSQRAEADSHVSVDWKLSTAEALKSHGVKHVSVIGSSYRQAGSAGEISGPREEQERYYTTVNVYECAECNLIQEAESLDEKGAGEGTPKALLSQLNGRACGHIGERYGGTISENAETREYFGGRAIIFTTGFMASSLCNPGAEPEELRTTVKTLLCADRIYQTYMVSLGASRNGVLPLVFGIFMAACTLVNNIFSLEVDFYAGTTIDEASQSVTPLTYQESFYIRQTSSEVSESSAKGYEGSYRTHGVSRGDSHHRHSEFTKPRAILPQIKSLI